MAKIYDVGSGVKFYTVSHAVGEGMPNSTDDVMLVQWLLKRHFSRNDKRAMLGNNIWAVDVINGVCSEQLIEVMKIYQYDAMLTVRGAQLKLNGKFYPIQTSGGLNKSPVAMLNLSVSTNFKKFYDNPKSDPFVYSDAAAMFDRMKANVLKAA
jgi:hypothetical protein